MLKKQGNSSLAGMKLFLEILILDISEESKFSLKMSVRPGTHSEDQPSAKNGINIFIINNENISWIRVNIRQMIIILIFRRKKWIAVYDLVISIRFCVFVFYNSRRITIDYWKCWHIAFQWGWNSWMIRRGIRPHINHLHQPNYQQRSMKGDWFW